MLLLLLLLFRLSQIDNQLYNELNIEKEEKRESEEVSEKEYGIMAF